MEVIEKLPSLSSGVRKEISDGVPQPLGATLTDGGVNFAIHSEYAHAVCLVLFDSADSPSTDIFDLKRTGNVWHVHVAGLRAGQLYGYKVNGQYNPVNGKRFNPHKLLLDPYAKAIHGKFKNQDNLIFAYDLNADGKDLVMDTRENETIVPKCIVVDEAFNWEGDKPLGLTMNELIIYEAHVKGMTAHSTAGVTHPGTYLGLIEKIPYLKTLGINAIELMPVQEFFVRPELLDKNLSEYWGYNTIGFFAPESTYSTQTTPGCQVAEFKTLVKELHKSGIEVILDVVYNHTGEGNHLGPTLCFKGVDNPSYFKLCQNPDNPSEPYRFYINDSGCGNTLNVENHAFMNLVLDSLRYWVTSMHVDGFRFDLASILARAHGEFSNTSLFFEAVSKDPILSKVKMIAEPWDLTTYQVGNFPQGWSEWNGKFRDTVRKFLKGDLGQSPDMATRLTGSADLYQDDGRRPFNSINFITCHDGFTLKDLYSYNEKHNEANGEENRDGSNDNLSWNCGAEGETDDPKVIALRKKMIKNAICVLLFSSGTPMLLYGDEIMRTQKGNNNTYCQDNDLTWFNWDDIHNNRDILEFTTKAIAFRKQCAVLRPRRFWTGEPKEGQIPDIAWYGKRNGIVRWKSTRLKTLSYQLYAHAGNDPYFLHLVFNMDHRGGVFQLPTHDNIVWYQLVDTAQVSGQDFYSFEDKKLVGQPFQQRCAARSVNVFWGKAHP
ncbi:MAG: glycogen debranching protein GlgX [Candidatus Omnitrophica bacterium]|nr:glycogen debranching protein GlgX [Candidatus Omnitrophota bacterium]